MENDIRLSPCSWLCILGKIRGKNTLEVNIKQYFLTQIQFKSHVNACGSGGVHKSFVWSIVCELR